MGVAGFLYKFYETFNFSVHSLKTVNQFELLGSLYFYFLGDGWVGWDGQDPFRGDVY
jgi:hypothetical protein